MGSPDAAFADAATPVPLFDRKHAFDDIAKELPKTPEVVLKPEFCSAIRNNPDHPFRAALRANDVYDWKSRAPLRLCHGGADLDVTSQNSIVARDRMKALAGDVDMVAAGTSSITTPPASQVSSLRAASSTRWSRAIPPEAGHA